ncbi:hypothetical protein NKJ35_01630 [Mesorhizobium sp. M0136]|uniref:hypothetical protein n=1 Tax=Mesorhizobium sp. M0136 TaxID=2956890 RepID=UPI00333A543F
MTITFDTSGMERGTHWSVQIDAESFEKLALAMAKAAPDVAAKAFETALGATHP